MNAVDVIKITIYIERKMMMKAVDVIKITIYIAGSPIFVLKK